LLLLRRFVGCRRHFILRLIVRARSLAAATRNSTGALFEFHGMVVALAAIAGRLGRRRFDKAAKNANRFITRRCQRPASILGGHPGMSWILSRIHRANR
jgi:hypothetical protein